MPLAERKAFEGKPVSLSTTVQTPEDPLFSSTVRKNCGSPKKPVKTAKTFSDPGSVHHLSCLHHPNLELEETFFRLGGVVKSWQSTCFLVIFTGDINKFNSKPCKMGMGESESLVFLFPFCQGFWVAISGS